MHRFSEDTVARARKVRVLLLDVDGVLTDGTIHLDNNGVEAKGFNIMDGLGLVLLQKAGIPAGIITGRDSNVVATRARELGLEILVQGCTGKLAAAREICAQRGLTLEQVAFVGDDLIDIGLMRQCGLAVSVPNGVPEAHAHAHHITGPSGGKGAVREVVELILKAQDKWDDIVAGYQ